MNPISEKLIAFRVYEDGTDYLGVADVTLPDLEPMTETVKGAGIAGEIESPVIGHFGSMTLTLNWRTLAQPAVRLAEQRAHTFDLRGVNQIYDAAKGTFDESGVRVVVRCVPKKTGLGKLDVGTTSDTTNEFEVSYIKIFINEVEELELDKYNYIYKIRGDDRMANIRRLLGLM